MINRLVKSPLAPKMTMAQGGGGDLCESALICRHPWLYAPGWCSRYDRQTPCAWPIAAFRRTCSRCENGSMHKAFGDTRIGFFPVWRFGDGARARRQALEDRVKAIHRRLVATDHHAIAALQPPHSARRADIEIDDARLRQRLRAADIVLEKC